METREFPGARGLKNGFVWASKTCFVLESLVSGDLPASETMIVKMTYDSTVTHISSSGLRQGRCS
jgi:hypothetical protein